MIGGVEFLNDPGIVTCKRAFVRGSDRRRGDSKDGLNTNITP